MALRKRPVLERIAFKVALSLFTSLILSSPQKLDASASSPPPSSRDRLPEMQTANMAPKRGL
jgi:hypothetical protein